MNAGRRWVAAGVALAVLVAVAVVLVVRHLDGPGCGGDEARVGASEVPRVFEAPPAAGRLGRLAGALDRMPFGRVVGAVGYDYGQWLTVGALPGRLAAWTKGNAVVGFLGADLRPRWGLRQAQVQHAWDADATHFFELELAKDRPLQVSSYSLADGRRLWCASVGEVPTRYADPLGTAALPGGGLLVLADAPGPAGTLSRIRGDDGSARWTRTLTGIDRGDFLGDLGDGVGVAGGRPSYELGDADVSAPSGPALRGFDEATGRPGWAWGDGLEVHVVGVSAGRLLLEQADGTALRLVALDRRGRQVWTTPAPAGTNADVALAGGMLVLRTDRGLEGIDPTTGRRAWRTPYPSVGHGTGGQLFPYGFALDAQPMIDAHHLLLGTTTALRTLDTRTGRLRSYALPIDGINTSFWPYQLTVAGNLLVVATNIGAVAVRRAD